MGPRLTGRLPPFFSFELRFPARENIARKRDRGAVIRATAPVVKCNV
jgi:hypothetical protein